MPGIRWASRLFRLLLILTACGCGDGSGSDNQQLNPGLVGKFLVTDGSTVSLMDAATGQYTGVPNTGHDYFIDKYPQATDFDVVSLPYHGDRFLVVACGETSLVSGQTFQGQSLFDLQLPFQLEGVSLSQDGRYLSLIRILDDGFFSRRLEILTTDGVPLGDTVVGAGRIHLHPMHWLSDYRLVYSAETSFHITSPLSAEVEYSIDLNDYVQLADPEMTISAWAISPDETRLVFALEHEEFTWSPQQLQIYIMDLDGSNLNLLASAALGAEGPVAFNPEWSPDGKWLFAEVGNKLIYRAAKMTHLYLIPINESGRTFHLSDEDQQRSPEVRPLWRYDYHDDEADISSRGMLFDYLYWLPEN
ncbi:MAG: hypothetical protein JAY90_14580 [Candidatus Thiodiazotropha lotti]|nr:hypothetical protein [Candidatus Thiodiazotropha lotti]